MNDFMNYLKNNKIKTEEITNQKDINILKTMVESEIIKRKIR